MRWPAMMRRKTAAEYCDMSLEQFDRQCPVAPVDQGWRGLRWKKDKLDRENEKPGDRQRGVADDRVQFERGGLEVACSGARHRARRGRAGEGGQGEADI